MNRYEIQHKILTLAHCAVLQDREKPATFVSEGIEFSHWDFNFRDGWKADAWIASAEMSAENFIDALNTFRATLSKLIPRISLISQSFIEFTREPFVVHKVSSDVAFFHYNEDVRGGGLMFMEKEQRALSELLNHPEVPEEFYYYWNDAVNASGYSAKLLLMFSAVEALARKGGEKNIAPVTEIFGEELTKELFERDAGLRHQLVHGKYFGQEHNGKNYLELIHNKVIEYFNTKVLSRALIQTGIVNPQRHFFGNKQGGHYIVKRKDGAQIFPLKDMLEDFNENGFQTPIRYEHVFDSSIAKSY